MTFKSVALGLSPHSYYELDKWQYSGGLGGYYKAFETVSGTYASTEVRGLGGSVLPKQSEGSLVPTAQGGVSWYQISLGAYGREDFGATGGSTPPDCTAVFSYVGQDPFPPDKEIYGSPGEFYIPSFTLFGFGASIPGNPSISGGGVSLDMDRTGTFFSVSGANGAVGTTVNVGPGSLLQDGKTHLIYVTWTRSTTRAGGSCRLYIDNVLKATINEFPTTSYYEGGFGATSQLGFLDEIVLYERVLTSTERANLKTAWGSSVYWTYADLSFTPVTTLQGNVQVWDDTLATTYPYQRQITAWSAHTGLADSSGQYITGSDYFPIILAGGAADLAAVGSADLGTAANLTGDGAFSAEATLEHNLWYDPVIAIITAAFTASSDGRLVTFDASSTRGDAVTYVWDFDDPAAGSDAQPNTGKTVQHVYAVGGRDYHVTLTVTDANGHSSTRDVTPATPPADPAAPHVVTVGDAAPATSSPPPRSVALPTSGNGWTASPDPDDIGIVPLIVNGHDFGLGVRGGDVRTVLSYVAQQVNDRVEPLASGGGYSFRANVNDASSLSNRASGTAIDYNSASHPATSTWTAVQIDEIHKILDEVDGVVRWGGDDNTDAGHFEINADAVSVAKVAARFSAPPPPVTPPGGDWWATYQAVDYKWLLQGWAIDDTGTITKFAESEALLWSANYSNPGWDLVEHPDGGVVLIGLHSSGGQNESDSIQMLRFGVSGDKFVQIESFEVPLDPPGWDLMYPSKDFVFFTSQSATYQSQEARWEIRSLRDLSLVASGASMVPTLSPGTEVSKFPYHSVGNTWWFPRWDPASGQPLPFRGVKVRQDGTLAIVEQQGADHALAVGGGYDRFVNSNSPHFPRRDRWAVFQQQLTGYPVGTWQYELTLQDEDGNAVFVQFPVLDATYVTNYFGRTPPVGIRVTQVFFDPPATDGSQVAHWFGYATSQTATAYTPHRFSGSFTIPNVVNGSAVITTAWQDLGAAGPLSTRYPGYYEATPPMENRSMVTSSSAGIFDSDDSAYDNDNYDLRAWYQMNRDGTYKRLETINDGYYGMGWGGHALSTLSPAPVPPPTFPLVAAFTFAIDDTGWIVNFDGSSSTGDIVTYVWDFDDELDQLQGSGETTSHFFQIAPSVYNVTLTVTDSNNQTASVTHPVTLAGGGLIGSPLDDERSFW